MIRTSATVQYIGRTAWSYPAIGRVGLTLAEAERLGWWLKPWYIPTCIWWDLWFQLCREVDARAGGGFAATVRAGDYSRHQSVVTFNDT